MVDLHEEWVNSAMILCGGELKTGVQFQRWFWYNK